MKLVEFYTHYVVTIHESSENNCKYLHACDTNAIVSWHFVDEFPCKERNSCYDTFEKLNDLHILLTNINMVE